MTKIPQFSRYLNVFAVSGCSALYVYNELFNTENKKLIMEFKDKNDKPLSVPPKMYSMITDVLNDLKKHTEKETHELLVKLKPFITKNVEFKSIGNLELKSNAFFGIPHHFLFDQIDDIDITALLEQYQIPSDAPECLELKRLMCLSDEAKKFVIAYEFYEIIYSTTTGFALLFTVSAIYASVASFIVEKKLKQAGKVIPLRVHFLILACGIIIASSFAHALHIRNEVCCDLFATDLGNSYLKGGIEFYEKLIERNKLIKKLNQNAPFTEEGDVKKFYSPMHHMPLKSRISYLKEKVTLNKNPAVWYYILLSI